MLEKATDSAILHVCQNLRETDRMELSLTHWPDADIAQTFICVPGAKYAVLRNGVPVCVFGVVPIFPNVGQAWLVGTDEIGKSGVEVLRACRTVINTLMNGHMHRIQAFSAAFYTQAHRWLENVGFHQESTLSKFGKDGSDFLVFAVTKR